MRYALIENNQVKDIFIKPEGLSIEECFTPSISILYIPCTDNISEGDFYNSDTKQFTENPNKKYPNYSKWIETLSKKEDELVKYSLKFIPIVNNLPMSFEKIGEYKTLLQFVLSGVDDMVDIDGQQFTGDDFKLMIDALKKFEEDKKLVYSFHSENFNSLNNAEDIDSYDFTTGWPETIISI